jgi:hypothetical protein
MKILLATIRRSHLAGRAVLCPPSGTGRKTNVVLPSRGGQRTARPALAGALLLVLATISVLALAGCSAANFPGFTASQNFDDVKPGELPSAWVGGITGSGQAQWAVVAVADAPSRPNVLQQSGQAKFCWCAQTNLSLRDGFVAVKFKPISGKEDQAGGLIWRWQDGDNYYVARANALENNVTIYHTLHGVRTEKGRASFDVTSGQWHDLRVDFHGPHFKVTFDGRIALQWNDETFKEAGAVGVWTKADSVTQFDNFQWGTGGDSL